MSHQDESEITTVDVENVEIEENVFSQPWKDSDVVLVVDGKEFHVHRTILAMHSDVFKAMFNGDFKDATKDRIELKDDNYEAMLLFLKLLYPSNLFDDDDAKVDIDDENIFDILVLADKYVAINIIKQCMKETERLQPENAMRLLPYAVRHKLSLEKILDVISRLVSTSKLASFASEQRSTSKDSVYDQCLIEKCRFLENVAKKANTMILMLLDEVVEKNKDVDSALSCFNGSDWTPEAQCVLKHRNFNVTEYKKARNCEYCLKAYKKDLINKYVVLESKKMLELVSCRKFGPVEPDYHAIKFQGSKITSSDFVNLLELLNNI